MDSVARLLDGNDDVSAANVAMLVLAASATLICQRALVRRAGAKRAR
jgi:hypothetical protein